MEIAVRNYKTGDAEAVSALVNACHEADHARLAVSTEMLLKRAWDEASKPEEQLLVAVSEGRTVAFCDLVREEGTRLVSRLWILPEWRTSQTGRLLLERRVALAGAFPEPMLDVPVRPSQADQASLLGSMGFVHVRTWWRMRADLLRDLPAPALPAGFTFRDASTGVGTEALTSLVNDTFSEHWGEGIHSIGEVQRHLDSPGFDPHLLVFAESCQRPVGYVWSWIFRDQIELTGDACAFIGDLGVTTAYRHRGLGRALLLHALNAVKVHGMQAAELEVDGPNASALHLYRSVGFQESDELRWYRRELQTPSRPILQAQSPEH